jgi:two-component system, chemotaxis family, chemotaxis protein CheY
MASYVSQLAGCRHSEDIVGARCNLHGGAVLIHGLDLWADKHIREERMREIRALIVDDSSVMRKIVERSLRQAGVESLVVFEAGSGIDGLEVLKARQVDLILSDINMPSMDGLEFVRQLRSQQLAAGVPVVMITTESSEEHVKQAIQAGAMGYIRKPFTADQVKQRVLSLLPAD